MINAQSTGGSLSRLLQNDEAHGIMAGRIHVAPALIRRSGPFFIRCGSGTPFIKPEQRRRATRAAHIRRPGIV